MEELIQEFATVFTVVDPIGTVPVYLAVTALLAPEKRRSVAIKATLVAAGVLIGFLVVGQLVLDAIGIELADFQIAGGIILFLFALSMIFGHAKQETETEAIPRSDVELAVYPLAIPSIAGPGAMLSVVVLTDNRTHPVMDQVTTAIIVLIVLSLTLALMLAAGPIQRLIGNAGAAIVSRVMGLILSALAVSTIITGIESRFGLG